MGATSRPEQRLLWELGARVRARRLELGLTQEQVAERAGKHRNEVGRVERGEKETGAGTIVRIAEALDLDLSALVEGLRSAWSETLRD